MENQLKQRIALAVKENDTVTRDVLRVVLGQIQTDSATKFISDEQKLAIVRKMIKSNLITQSAMQETPQENWSPEWIENSAKLQLENEILKSLLPQTWSVGQITECLNPLVESIRGAKAEGQALGMAMKALKAAGAVVESDDVKAVVQGMRS